MKLSSFGQIATRSKIDSSKGIIFGVSVITVGEAEGHELMIDTKTLEQVKTQAETFSDGLKVRMNHPDNGQATIQSIVGSLKNFRIEGKSVRADLHLLKSDENFDKIIELAETQPENFGLSIVFSGKAETEDDVKLARCTEIYACDLVDTPAANPTGLFSKKDTSMSKTIKYAKGDSGDHAKDCECKMCMEKGEKGEKESKMSAIFASLGLSENSTADDFVSALGKKLKPDADAALLERLAKLEKQDAQTLALSNKTQIDHLLAEAAANGKVVPFEMGDLYEEKDGVLTVKMQPTALAKVISKLTPTVKTPKTSMGIPKDPDGKPLPITGLHKRRNPTQLAAVQSYCEQQRELNAPIIGAHIKRLHVESMEKQTMN
jgi:hypothetical protein